MIKAGIWDLGGVLFTNGTKAFVKKIADRYSLDEVLIQQIMDGEIGSKYRENKISKKEFWQEALSVFGINADPEQLNNEWIDEYHLIEGTRDIILELGKKFPQYYLSDNVVDRIERTNEKTGFLNWFKDGIFSYEASVRKPDPRFYELILQKAMVKAEETFYVDDKKRFLEPAANLGIHTMLFTNPTECRAYLEKLGVFD